MIRNFQSGSGPPSSLGGPGEGGGGVRSSPTVAEPVSAQVRSTAVCGAAVTIFCQINQRVQLYTVHHSRVTKALPDSRIVLVSGKPMPIPISRHSHGYSNVQLVRFSNRSVNIQHIIRSSLSSEQLITAILDRFLLKFSTYVTDSLL